ncbi:MAG: BMP family ABC transporter substrate-binding protein [Thermodesulfobacteriota bacterium]
MPHHRPSASQQVQNTAAIPIHPEAAYPAGARARSAPNLGVLTPAGSRIFPLFSRLRRWMIPRFLVYTTLFLLVFFASLRADEPPFMFGLLLVGPHDDRGYSQAHYEGGRYAEQVVPNTKMICFDKVNPTDRKGVTIPQLVDVMAEKGARLIFATSDDMKEGIREAAVRHPEMHFVHCSGDDILTGKAPKNLTNLFGRMEYGTMMSGFVAAMTTENGKIGFVGALVNSETRRLASSCYLGARYAWTQIRKQPSDILRFEVSWIGFWFPIPGVTKDPSEETTRFLQDGFDVVISGIDTPDVLRTVSQFRNPKKQVYAIPYDYADACSVGPNNCLGVPYFNWGPGYVKVLKAAISKNWKSEWLWLGPDWLDINNQHSSTIGFRKGPALSQSVAKELDTFIAGMAKGTIELFTGPLLYSDGSVFLPPGKKASLQDIWYMKHLLQGMTEKPMSGKP